MNSDQSIRHAELTLTTLVLAGLAGGIAEVAWVGIYSAFADLSPLEILRQIVATASPGLAASSAAPALGLATHFTLAVALAIGYGHLIGEPIQRRSLGASMLAATAALAMVWALNFFVVLPVLNPGFVELMPYPVSLVSKLLFGVAMGGVLFQRRREFTLGRSRRFAVNVG